MKIRQRLIIVFSVLLVAAIGITSVLTLYFVERVTVKHEIEQMRSSILDVDKDIQFLHARASEHSSFALKNPLFVEYFSIPETKAGNQYDNEIIQFTPRQRALRSRLEDWIFHFQTKFTIDETCLIDATGQEHVRVFLNNIETDDKLSSREDREPFFQASFEKSEGEVHVEYPYFSSDSHRWVFAYTSPVVLSNGAKPAFFHFEMPIKILHDLLKRSKGRMYVLDPTGFLMADTKTPYPTRDIDIPSNFAEYFPSIRSVSMSESFANLFETMKATNDGNRIYVDDGEVHHVAYRKLTTFDWILAYEVTESEMMSRGHFSVHDLEVAVAVLAGTVTIVAIGIVFFMSNRITRPIVSLRDATKHVANGRLDTNITVKGDDEIYDLAESFGAMTKSLRKTIELEKRLAVSEEKLKETKLTVMGSASARFAHDMRNLLSTIKTTVELIGSRAHSVDKRTEEHYKRLNRAVEKMAFQVKSVMDFVKTNPLHMTEHSIGDLVESSLSDIEIPPDVTINISGSETRLKCDGKSMEIVLRNLITNAIQAVDAQGAVIMRAEKQNDKCVIEVEDSGPGIPEENMSRIFEPLYTTKEEGTGLGLVSCRTIVEQHDGTLTVRNNPTRFIIELPSEPVVDRQM